ncbi:MAG TPA: hypothetical protein VFQ51_11495 [Vicinamibacteria bacterium]|nr:hypothetical protein [Vicinamibacteria bacterium]
MLTAAIAVTAATAVVLALRARGRGWIDRSRLVLVLAALWFLPSVYGRIGGDGNQYYILLRSPVLDLDLDFDNDFAGLGASPVMSVQGESTSRMPIGAAVSWLPPFLLVHLFALATSALGAPWRADGFGPLYQATITTATYVYVVAALVGLEAYLRRRHGAAIALLSTLGIFLATPLLYYATANPSMSHGVQAAAGIAFVLAWLWARESEERRRWVVTGLLGGLVCVVRPQDGVLLALPLLDLARRGRRALPVAPAFLAGPAALGLLQLVVWLKLYGLAFADVISGQSYVGHTASYPIDLMFSARHGLFTWTPLYLAAVLGWLLWARRDLWTAGLAIVVFALAVAVNGAMQDWWGSESFGQRRMLGLTPLFALGLGETLAFLRRRPLLLPAMALVALVAWNLQFAYIFNSEMLAPRTQAVSLDRLAATQVEVLYRTVARHERSLPPRLFLLLYDNLKGVWLDEGPRSLAGTVDLGGEEREELGAVIGHNWSRPDREDGVGMRRSRGRKSWLRLPIRTPADFDAVLRARSEMGDLPVHVTVEVNGTVVATPDVGPGWSDYRFVVPQAALRPGFNEMSLACSTTPRDQDPAHQGRDAAIAVDVLKLERRETRDGPV